MVRMPPGVKSASAVSTSPFGSTWIQRGCLRPAANALTLSPGAATGVRPGAQPWAVGILSVGMLPCGFAGGIVGALPTAGTCWPPCSRRHAEDVARELASRYQVNAAAFACDITDGAAVQALITQVTGRFGRLDVLVNDAAYNKSISFADLDELTLEVWDNIMAVNLTGP